MKILETITLKKVNFVSFHRPADKLLFNRKKIGKVTSAVYSPRLKKNIALAKVEINHSEIGNNLSVISDYKEISSTIIEKPFYDPKKKIASS